MYSLMTRLVAKFCDTLIALQVNSNDSWDGGIMCPYCKSVIGRTGDAIFPLYFMYLQTRREKYLTAARKLVEYNQRIQLPDGAWTSHEMGSWKGTTVFKLLALIHAYDILNKHDMTEEALGLKGMIAGAARWTSLVFGEESIENNVNYFVTSATVLEWAARILEIPYYSEQGKKLIYKYGLGNLNRDGFLLGEGTRKSIMPVDIGYNLDMSLGVMAEYALLTGDPLVKSETVRALKTHLCFVYPDGSIDNSFGCRNYKWTLFGSKTAHGCQMALCLLCDEEPAFARAAELNARYLESLCSEDYLIGYGPDYWHYYKLGCSHPTFNRADAMAIAITYGRQPSRPTSKIPNEESFGIRYYPSINVAHIRTKGLLATISGFATHNSPSGGAVSYLWSEQAGPIQLGCVTEYDRDDEPQNIPEYPVAYKGPITPRLEVTRGGKNYSNLYEYESKLITQKRGDNIAVKVLGRLRDKNYAGRDDSGLCYTIDYTFGPDWVEKRYLFDLQYDCDKLSIVEPVVCSPQHRYDITKNGAIVSTPTGKIEVTSAGDEFIFQKDDSSERILSIFPSVTCLPLTWQQDNAQAGVYQYTISIKINA